MRGDSGKLASAWMSLSTKSMASCGCAARQYESGLGLGRSARPSCERKEGGGERERRYVRLPRPGSQWREFGDLFKRRKKKKTAINSVSCRLWDA